MNEQYIIDLIIKLTSSLVPGLLAYVVLYKTNIIFPQKNRSEENKILISALSLLNVMLGMMFYQISAAYALWFRVIMIFIFLILFSVFVIPLVTEFLLNCLHKWINWYRREENYGHKGPKTNFVEVFDHPNPMRISIFDFSGHHVLSGSTKHISDDNQFDYFDWVATNIMSYDELSQNEAIEMYKSAEQNKMGTYLVYVDFEKKLIFHTFKENMRQERSH